MRFWIDSQEGELLFLARRLKEDGHEVTLQCKGKNAGKVGTGLVPKANYGAPAPGAVVLMDGVGHGVIGHGYRARHAVVGGNPIDKDLELDRVKATKLFREHDLKTPETHVFRDIQQAQIFVDSHGDDEWFFKPSGNLECDTTSNFRDPENLIRYLTWARTHVKGLKEFELQKRVSGVEVSTEGWFDGRRFVPPFNSTLEEKRFFPGDIGPRTGCQSNVVWVYDTEVPEIAKRTVVKLEPLLRRERYQGPIDLNCIFTEAGEPVVLEASARFGFDALQALSLLVRGDWGEQLQKFALGKLDHFELEPQIVGATLRVTVPPYPIEDAQVVKDEADLPLDQHILSDVRRYMVTDVCKGADGRVVLAGGSFGNVLCVGEKGAAVAFEAVQRKLVEAASRLDMPNAQYRNDPIARAQKAWKRLDGMGLLADAAAFRGTGKERRYGVSPVSRAHVSREA